jgi:hypothetical protein
MRSVAQTPIPALAGRIPGQEGGRGKNSTVTSVNRPWGCISASRAALTSQPTFRQCPLPGFRDPHPRGLDRLAGGKCALGVAVASLSRTKRAIRLKSKPCATKSASVVPSALPASSSNGRRSISVIRDSLSLCFKNAAARSAHSSSDSWRHERRPRHGQPLHCVSVRLGSDGRSS